MYFCLSSRSTSGPPGGCPLTCLKASTPYEAPTPALTTKTLVPTTANRRSMRTKATRRALTFTTVVKRANCAALEAPYQQRGNVSPKQPNWSLDTPLLQFNAVTLGRTVGLQDCSGEMSSLSEDQKLCKQQVVPSITRHKRSQESLPHSHRPCKQWGCPLSSCA